jgi:hypothetical protein
MISRSFPNGGFMLFDHDLRYVLADGVGLKYVDLSKEGLERKTIWEALPEETCQAIEPSYRAALLGEETTFEMPFPNTSSACTSGRCETTTARSSVESS